jgi:Spy/CpxP family protein refolding chaperone
MRTFSLVAALALGGLVACGIMANAQEAKGGKSGSGRGGDRGGRPTVEQQLEQMTTELGLTDAQKPKVKVVLEDYAKKTAELYASGDRNQAREKAQPFRDERTKKMKEILTPEQFGKYEKAQEERSRSRFSGGDRKKKEQ